MPEGVKAPAWSLARQVADAVLYEGYLLYPYRLSALKNRYRWTFGVLYPEAFCLRENAGDRSEFRAACLIEAAGDAVVALRVRFLQHSDGAVAEREVALDDLVLGRLEGRPRLHWFHFLGVQGELGIEATALEDELYRLSIAVCNRTPFSGEGREAALDGSLLSCHALLAVDGGRFISPTDPPVARASQIAQCRNVGLWPVLVGDPQQRNILLCSPVILPDYPAVAPESPGDLFDGTEIDELLTLRILTLTEAEKDEMRRVDERSRRILERTETLSREEILGLHGMIRSGSAAPAVFHPGQRVRLRPAGRADIFDLELDGREATVVSLDQDLEGRIYVSVTVSGDPGEDLGRLGLPGHRFFFRPQELEAM